MILYIIYYYCAISERVYGIVCNKVIDERSAEFDRIWAKHQSGKNAESGEDEETEGGIPIRIGKRMAFLDMLLWTAKKDESLTKDGIQEEVDTFMFEARILHQLLD